MTYQPINDETKLEWITWCQEQVDVLNGKEENKNQNSIFETPDGDVANAKDLVGNLLAILTNKPITIN